RRRSRPSSLLKHLAVAAAHPLSRRTALFEVGGRPRRRGRRGAHISLTSLRDRWVSGAVGACRERASPSPECQLTSKRRWAIIAAGITAGIVGYCAWL